MVITSESHHIDGSFRPSHSRERIPVVDPATEETFATIVDGDAADIDAAVRAAAAAGSDWAALEPSERAGHLRQLADAFEGRAEEMSRLVTRQNGTPISVSRAMQAQVPLNYRYFASLADRLVTEEPLSTSVGDTLLRREPVGVVGAITPWNGPQPLIAWKVGPALAAGCTAVIKPAPETTLDAFFFAEIATEAGIPAGVLNVVSGGRETGATLVGHPLVRKVAFTGSTAAGRAIAAACGRELKRVTLELGGKSAAILLDDIDLDAFRPFVASACSPNTGQTCRSLTRVLAPRSRYDEVVEAVADALRGIPQGDPNDPANFFGPLVSARQRDRVETYIELGRREGARVVVGGGRPDITIGFYVQPTVFRDVTNNMRIAREEIFGPVLVVIPYETEDEAVALANDSEYGLGGGVFSTDRDRATAVARRIETGTIGVNSASFPMEAPFGGVKNSGIGRELGPASLDPYLELKTIFRST
ncbi:aldehyde dehydrogenase [Streptomyces cinereoruber]|uniref:Aldehyde dehydrogenase n=1 Tax=Streptomyces cinereoruber TaxID=67260 RepID=A0ABX6BL34_9ACTN|nr:aldehyde dehydrogenase [Streptomyces cinereoruber]MBB4158227.1 acyl-CoA reductase-like NAD-dependent aldehyde dehydrogenase [Streptomyces cinereoruber]MBY8819239.1 aldehyde dehydrogenase [Streptomyces cinereoruber]NIH63360.1 acyl-CoA reductase-like NAD-dependent aldehyde dehydrogenase [Streptomyces cinereoruber]QEV36017.1 aldehyde dehydrogenase [Streptomyces cinereoruber]